MNATPTAPTVKADRYGCRAPKGGITIRGRFFRGGCFCWNAPADAPAPAPALPTRTVIGGFAYAIAPQRIAPSVGSVAVALEKLATRNTYFVHRDNHGEVCCDCPDFTMRRAGTGTPCKHGQALVDLGAIPATTPRVLPPLASRPAPAVAARARGRRFEPSADDMAHAAALLGWRA